MAYPTQNLLRLLPGWNRAALAWIGFYGLVLLAWLAVFAMARQNPALDMPTEFWASLCVAAGQASFGPLVAMWGLMALAMMLPTFVPALRCFLDLSQAGATNLWGAAALVGGYLLVWAAAAVVGAGAQYGLSNAGLLALNGASISGWLTAVLLLGAGAYQFTTLKEACLAKCRMPLSFFMERWAPGLPRALRMGVELGVLCLGCCWALMALGFVGGTMNLMWMGAATLFMTLEKLPDIGRWLTRPVGFALIAAGGFTALHTLVTG
jgi:predicted metal-binding membrane protein